MTIKRNVRFILRAKRMTQKQLAEKIGLTPSTLSTMVNSENIGLKSLQLIANGLEVQPSDLLSNPPLSYSNREFKTERNKPTVFTFQCPSCGRTLKAHIKPD